MVPLAPVWEEKSQKNLKEQLLLADTIQALKIKHMLNVTATLHQMHSDHNLLYSTV